MNDHYSRLSVEINWMDNKLTEFKNTRNAGLVLLASILVSGFWLLEQKINVYRAAFTGAVFEILWLPMLAGLLAIPIISIVQLIKVKGNIRSFYLYSLVIMVLGFLFVLFNHTPSR